MVTTHFTYHLSTIDSVAKDLLKQFNSKIVLFNGEMGAGKTTLIKALLKEMGSTDDVKSPTFSIVNEYKTEVGNVFHFDFYRIEDIEEAYNFGIEDYFASDNYLFLEWAENVEALLPKNICVVDITTENHEKRSINFKKYSKKQLKTKVIKH